jgi:hypothetical protein
MNASMITWRVTVDPKSEDTEDQERFVRVSGGYKHYIFNGQAILEDGDDESAYKTIAHLEAGITNLIIGAIDEEMQMERVDWSGMDAHIEEDGSCTMKMFGLLDHDPEKRADTAVCNLPADIIDPAKSDQQDYLHGTMKQIIWTEFRTRGWV